MAGVRRFVHRLLTLLRPDRAETELSREVEAHLRLLEDTFVGQGMSAEDARYAAKRAFGGVEQAKEHQRDARSFRWLTGWPMDVKLGVRMLIKSPGLTVVAVIALSLFIGASVLYLEAVGKYYHPTFPGPDGDRVVAIVNWDAARDAADERSQHDFVRFRKSLQTIEHVGAFTRVDRNLITDDGRSEPVDGIGISASIFRILRTPPVMGRVLLPDDERLSSPPVVVIGHHLWTRRFDNDPGILGRTVTFGDTAYSIVGVMPEGFGFPVNSSLWVPLRLTDAGVARGEGPWLRMFGRLAPGTELATAQAEVSAVGMRIASDLPGSNPHLRSQVKPYLESRASSGSEKLELRLLYAFNLLFVGLLAICGANVATLVFARTATREGEITVRTALGASRRRIVAQLFAEALVLVSFATVFGLIGASVGLREFTHYLTVNRGLQVPFWWNDDFSPATFGYAALLTVFAAAIVGIVPALKATGPQMQARLKHAAGGQSTLKFGALWTGVIVAQVALTVFFLLTAFSLAWNAQIGKNAGVAFRFVPGQFLVARVEMDPQPDYATRFAAVYEAIERRLEEAPGVAGVTYATHLPGSPHESFMMQLEGSSDGQPPVGIRAASVAPDFFETFDAPIVRGRTFTLAEARGEHPVAIVTETFVREILGGRDPIGIRVRRQRAGNGEAPPWLEIVGVVKDPATTKNATTEDAVLYRPAALGVSDVRMAVRFRGDAAGRAQQIRDIAAAAAPNVRLNELSTLADVHNRGRRVLRLMAQALTVVAAVGLLLATAGVYALLSFTIARRTREIGIRAALGAAPRRIITAIFSRAFLQIGLGVVVGSLPGGALVLYGGVFEGAAGGGVKVTLIAIAIVAATILAIALFSCAVPARRALRIQPTDALRAE